MIVRISSFFKSFLDRQVRVYQSGQPRPVTPTSAPSSLPACSWRPPPPASATTFHHLLQAPPQNLAMWLIPLLRRLTSRGPAYLPPAAPLPLQRGLSRQVHQPKCHSAYLNPWKQNLFCFGLFFRSYSRSLVWLFSWRLSLIVTWIQPGVRVQRWPLWTRFLISSVTRHTCSSVTPHVRPAWLSRVIARKTPGLSSEHYPEIYNYSPINNYYFLSEIPLVCDCAGFHVVF